MTSTLRIPWTGLSPSNPIAAAAVQSRDLLLQCTYIPALMQLEWAENRLAEFKMWAATTGALAGGSASLDARLINEPDAKDLVKGLLVLLTQCLEKCKRFALPSEEETEEVTEELDEVDAASEDDDEWWANDVQEMDSAPRLDAGRDIPRGFSPWSDDSSSHPGSGSRSEAEETSPLLVAEAEVEQIINHLARVALAIRKSGTASRLHKADRTFDPNNHQNLRRHLELIILARGREDGSSDYHIDREALTAIHERLILANLRRRNRYRYAQKHADKLAVDSTSTDDTGSKSTPLEVSTLCQNEGTIRAPATAQIAKPKSEQEEDTLPQRNLVMTATSASGVAQAIEAVPEQTLPPSQVAKTNITTTAAKVLYPKPPKLKMPRYFKCPCCFQHLPDMYREKTQWKKHMMADICPYMCILDECPTPEKLYVTRHEWAGHIEKSHRQCWQCPACSVLGRPPVIFPSVEIFLHHLRETHNETISEEQYSTIVKEAARPIPPGICRCPLCDSSGPADSPDLLDHIAEHLHNFALRSLPWPDDRAEDDEARDPGDPYFNARNYFDQESENDSVQDVSIDSDRDLDGLASLSSQSSDDDSDHDLPMEASPTDGEENQRMDQMRRWLSPPDLSTNLVEAKEWRDEHSAARFPESPIFTDWKTGDERRLFVYGPAGSGKTLFSRNLLHHLQETEPGPILAFFFDVRDDEKRDFESLIRSLAWQLYQHATHILDSLYRSYDDGMRQPDIGRLSNTVKFMFQSSKGAYVIIDALDECTARIQVLSWLEALASDPKFVDTKLMVTGRPEISLLESIPDIFGVDNCITLGHGVKDISVANSYVDARLRQDLDFTTKSIPQSLLTAIRLRVGKGSGSRFRWAVCQMDALARCSSPDDIESALENLPSTLDETYRRLLQSVPANHKGDGVRLLQFLVWAKEPLTLSEANDILATRIDMDPPQFNVHHRLDDERQILHYCPGLLSVVPTVSQTEGPKRVWLSHSTIAEFLVAEYQFGRRAAAIPITQTVLTYLKYIDIDNSLKDVSAHFPLAERAAKMMMAFAKDAEADDDVLSEISSFLSDPAVLDRFCRLSQISTGDHQVSPLFVACKLGLRWVAGRLLEDGVDVNEGSRTQHDYTFVASQEGHGEIVELLLQHGANVGAGKGASWVPLQAATNNGHRHTVELLLEHGADPNATSDLYDTPLQAASKNGYLDIVRLLLDCGADVNTRQHSKNRPITFASSTGHIEIVQLLISKGAEANNYALYEASRNGHIDVVKLLLKKRPRLSGNVSNFEDSALEAASKEGHARVVEYLKLHFLCLAAKHEDHDAVKALLDQGASPDGSSSLGTPLKIAAEQINVPIVKLLLQRGADVSIAADGKDLVAYYENSLQPRTTRGILNLLRKYRSGGLVHDD